MPHRSYLVPFVRTAEDLFAAAERLRKASERPLLLEEAEKLVAEAEDAVHRCRRVLNSARFLGEGRSIGRSVCG
ncbi:MAG: hypothetical protein C4570_04705 [Ammonifex sp.]|nr:MAG: hypothetical protein C4570_04705 [Ammonifex sp.]